MDRHIFDILDDNLNNPAVSYETTKEKLEKKLDRELFPEEEKLINRLSQYKYGLDTGEGCGVGGLHQLTNEEALAVQTKRFKDGEIMLPNTFYTENCAFHPRENDEYVDKWNVLKRKVIDYRFNKTGSHEDGRYCVAISVTDLLKWMEELEDEDE